MATLDQRVAKLEAAMPSSFDDDRTIIIRWDFVEPDGTISEVRTKTYIYDADYNLISHTEERTHPGRIS